MYFLHNHGRKIKFIKITTTTATCRKNYFSYNLSYAVIEEKIYHSNYIPGFLKASVLELQSPNWIV